MSGEIPRTRICCKSNTGRQEEEGRGEECEHLAMGGLKVRRKYREMSKMA
jgi:hypothetical protein